MFGFRFILSLTHTCHASPNHSLYTIFPFYRIFFLVVSFVSGSAISKANFDGLKLGTDSEAAAKKMRERKFILSNQAYISHQLAITG